MIVLESLDQYLDQDQDRGLKKGGGLGEVSPFLGGSSPCFEGEGLKRVSNRYI